MNITVKVTNDKEFTLYSPDFVPQHGDTIIKDDKIYVVDRRVWDDDNGETVIYATLNCVSVPTDVSDSEIIELGKSGKKLQAVKLYKELHKVGLKEAAEWVNTYC